jgi:hypothetical protein
MCEFCRTDGGGCAVCGDVTGAAELLGGTVDGALVGVGGDIRHAIGAVERLEEEWGWGLTPLLDVLCRALGAVEGVRQELAERGTVVEVVRVG